MAILYSYNCQVLCSTPRTRVLRGAVEFVSCLRWNSNSSYATPMILSWQPNNTYVCICIFHLWCGLRLFALNDSMHVTRYPLPSSTCTRSASHPSSTETSSVVINLSLSLSLSLYLYLRIFLFFSLTISLFLSFSLCLFLSFSLSLCVSIYVSRDEEFKQLWIFSRLRKP
jgi:hypothetical protein